MYPFALCMGSQQKRYVFFTIQDCVVFCSIDFGTQYNGDIHRFVFREASAG